MNKLILSFLSVVFLTSGLKAQVQVDKQIQLTGNGSDAKVTGIQQVNAPQDAVSAEVLQKNSLQYAAATNAGNTLTVNLTPAPAAYTTGMVVHFKSPVSVTGAWLLSVNGLTGIPIKKNYNADLAANDILSGQLVSVMYDGTNFQMLSQSGNASGGTTPDCITLSTKTSPSGYYYTGYKQTFTDEGLWYATKTNYPKPRKYLKATAYNSAVYVFGHAIVSGSSTDNYLSYKFTPSSNTWTTLANLDGSMNYDMYGIEEVNGKFYFIAGLKGSSCGDGATWQYDPVANTYSQLASNVSRYQQATAVYNSEIYSFGGQGNCCGGCYTTNAYKYTPATNTWTTKANLPLGRYGQVAETVNNKIYIIGGYDSNNLYSSTVYEYDPVANTYTTKTSMPTARNDMASAVYNNKIYVFGGSSNNTGTEVVVEVYDPANNTWKQGENLPAGRAQFGAATVGTKIYIIGGSYGSSAYNTTWEYDPTLDPGPVFYMHCKQ